ncbi:hypothetical protein ACFFRR_010056 [Megaselia abdita]
MEFFWDNYTNLRKRKLEIEDTLTSLSIRIRGLQDLLDKPDISEKQKRTLEREITNMQGEIDATKEHFQSLKPKKTSGNTLVACYFFVGLVYVYFIYCVLSNVSY